MKRKESGVDNGICWKHEAPQFFFFKMLFKNICVCVACMYAYVPDVCLWRQKRAADSLELQLQMLWTAEWVLETKPGPGKSSWCSDGWAICPAPWYLMFVCFATKAVRMKWVKRGRCRENSCDMFVTALLMERTLKLQSQETASLTTEDASH